MHSAASQTLQLRLASIRVLNENRFQIYCYILPGHENQQDARGLKPSVGNVKMELQKNKTKQKWAEPLLENVCFHNVRVSMAVQLL